MRGILQIRLASILGIGLMASCVYAQQTEPLPVRGNPQMVDRAQLIYAPPAVTIPAVRLSINGSTPMLFLLASSVRVPIAIDIEKAKQLGIHRSGVVSLDSVRFVDPQGRLSSIKHIFPRVVVTRLSLGRTVSGEEIAGVLGSGFFATMPVRLDLRHNRLELLNATADTIMEQAAGRYVAVKLSPIGARSDVHTVPILLPEGRKIAMVIATESNTSSLIEKDLKGIELMEICPSAYLIKRYFQEKGLLTVSTILGRLAWLSIAGFKVEDVWLTIDCEGVKEQSIIGMDVLSCFDELILDYATGYLLLKKPEGRLRGRLVGVSGVSIRRDSSGRVTVQHVAPQSAGARAGFQKGDRVVAIAGQDVDTWQEEGVQMLLDGYAGIAQPVTIEREGIAKELILTPDNGCSSATSWGRFGFSASLVTVGSDVFFLVTHIHSDQARRAGLRVGDRIIAMNGYAVQEYEEMLPNLVRDAKRLELRVKHLGEDKETLLQIPAQNDG